jgi:hypothetical protein
VSCWARVWGVLPLTSRKCLVPDGKVPRQRLLGFVWRHRSRCCFPGCLSYRVSPGARHKVMGTMQEFATEGYTHA